VPACPRAWVLVVEQDERGGGDDAGSDSHGNADGMTTPKEFVERFRAVVAAGGWRGVSST
jgi:hypothetical protein